MAILFEVQAGGKVYLQVASSEGEAREMVASIAPEAVASVERIGDAFIAWELVGELRPAVPVRPVPRRRALKTYRTFNRAGRPVRVTIPEKES